MSSIPHSKIHIPILLSFHELELIINEQLGEQLYEDQSMDDGDNIMASAKKQGAIQIAIHHRQIRYSVPLALWIKRRIALSDIEAEGIVELQFSTDLTIKSDWNLEGKTRLEGYKWLQKPLMKLGALDMPVRMLADQLLSRRAERITAAIDQKLHENLKLREQVIKVWDKLAEPILVHKAFQLWLSLQPESISMAPLTSDGETIRSAINISTLASLVMSRHPQRKALPALPPFSETRFSEETSQLYLRIGLPYTDATALARQFLQGKTFEQAGHEVELRDVQIDGDGSKLMLQLQLSGDYDGELDLTAEPVFDKVLQQVSFEALDFSLNTDNLLHKGIGWLLKKSMMSKIQEKLIVPIEAPLKELHDTINEKLEQFEVAPEIFLKGRLHQLDVQRIYLRPNAIRLEVLATADIQLLVQGLSRTTFEAIKMKM